MSGLAESETTLVRENTTLLESAAAVTVGLAAVLFVLSLAALFEIVTITDPIAGIPIGTILEVLLLALGLVVIGFGLASRFGYVETAPDPTAGLVVLVVFSGTWFVVGLLVGSFTIGLGTVEGLATGALAAGAVLAIVVLTPEDVGSTLPAGAMAVFAGLVFLTGLIGPDWAYSPAGFDPSFTFFSRVVVPSVVLFCALLVGWGAAKAYGGFGARGRHLGAHVLIYLNTLAIVAVLLGLLAYVAVKGMPGLLQGLELGLGTGPETTISLFGFSYMIVWPVSWPFLMNGAAILNDVDGVLPAIVGTVWLVVGAVLFAVPLGVGAGLFLSEYASEGRFTQVVEIATNGLWSTPSIVFGLFGAAFLIPRFGGTKSLLAGQLTLGFMLLPLVVITSREAMLAVPDEYRDASAALGVSKWETIRSVVLPAALPGVTTGVILGVGRIAGETAPILLTMAGGTFVPENQTLDVLGGFELSWSPPFVTNNELLQSTTALPYQVYALIRAGLEGPQIDNPDNFAWGLVLVLLLVVLAFYAFGIATRYYFRKKLHQ